MITTLTLQNINNKKSTESQKQILTVEVIPIGKKTNIKIQSDKEKSTKNHQKEIVDNSQEQITTNNQANVIEKTSNNAEEIINLAENTTSTVITNTTTTTPTQEQAKQNTQHKKNDTSPPTKTIPKAIRKPKQTTSTNKDKINNKEDELFNLLQNIAETKDKNIGKQDLEKTNGKKGISNTDFNKKEKESIRITDMIQSRFMSCWNIPVAAKDIENMRITIKIELSEECYVTKAKIVDYERYTKDNFFRAVVDSALRAIQECSPIKEIEQYDYNIWSKITLTFDPSFLS